MLALLPKILRTQRKLPLGRPSVFMFLTKYKKCVTIHYKLVGINGKELVTHHALFGTEQFNESKHS